MQSISTFTGSQNRYFLGRQQNRFKPMVARYCNHDYLKLLNKLLNYELGTIDLYRRTPQCSSGDLHLDCRNNHKSSAQTVIDLIVINQGIPEKDSTNIPTELSLLANKISQQLGKNLASKTSCSICLRMEHLLQKRYKEALVLAPPADKIHIQHLLRLNHKNIEELTAPPTK